MTLELPYTGTNEPWLKGNLHTHTTYSDGKLTVDEVVAYYQEGGYDFLALTDHDGVTPLPAADGIVLISGDEVSYAGPHLCAVGTTTVYDTSLSREEIVGAIVADGGLCTLNHPHWLEEYSHWPLARMMGLPCFHGIEVYNGVIEFLPGEAVATDCWDYLLSRGRRVWGLATDDFHDPRQGRRGFCVVQAERDAGAIVEALKAGRFYASNGVMIDRIVVEGDTLTVESAEAQEIRFFGKHGVLLAGGDGPTESYRFTGKELYVRAEVYGRGKQVAWTQPVFVAKES